ncbi:hypothetical protein [Bradyrhizobium murdochi]|nr:hypothetical protein [Bradyrhizobium murdochi]
MAAMASILGGPKEFVSLINENVNGSPFEIRAAAVRADAEMMLKKIQD